MFHLKCSLDDSNVKPVNINLNPIVLLSRSDKMKLMCRGISRDVTEFSVSEFNEFSDKIFIIKQIIRTCQLLCTTERIFKLAPIHASEIYQIP